MSDATKLLHAVNAGIQDVLKGYESLKERAEAEIQGVARDLDAMHRRHAGEIGARLATLGEDADDGTLRGTINQAVTAVRDWVGSLDADALAFVRKGEELCLANYEAALEEDAVLDPTDRQMIERQAGEIRTKVAALSAT